MEPLCSIPAMYAKLNLNGQLTPSLELTLTENSLVSSLVNPTLVAGSSTTLFFIGQNLLSFASAKCIFKTDPLQLTDISVDSATSLRCDSALVPESTQVEVKIRKREHSTNPMLVYDATIDSIDWYLNYYLDSPLAITYLDPAPSVVSAEIVSPGDQIVIIFDVSVALTSGENLWQDRNCSFFVSDSSNLWRDGFEDDCTAIFRTKKTLVFTFSAAVTESNSTALLPGSSFEFISSVIERETSFSNSVQGIAALSRSSGLTSTAILVINSPYWMNSCSNLRIDVSAIGNLAGRSISAAEISYIAANDSSDTSLTAFLGITVLDFPRGTLAITVPSSLITARTYNVSMNASSTLATSLADFQFTRASGPNFPTVTINLPSQDIRASEVNIIYAFVDAPCSEISNPTLIFEWKNDIGVVISTSSNLVLLPYQLEFGKTYTFTLDCSYNTFAVITSAFSITTKPEDLRVSAGGDQIIGLPMALLHIGLRNL
ncbi:MAG: hypothetical protein SGCHY_002370 [Lobulomycetales sp.]